MKASTSRAPATQLYTTGNEIIPGAKLGKLVGLLSTTHVLVLKVRPAAARAGFWASLFSTELILAAPSDLEDLRGKKAILRGLGVVRYTHDLYWLHHDLEHDATRMRWARLLHESPNIEPEDLLVKVQGFFRDAVDIHLATQEELAALDINAQSRRSIAFGDPDRPHSVYLEREARGDRAPPKKQNSNQTDEEEAAA